MTPLVRFVAAVGCCVLAGAAAPRPSQALGRAPLQAGLHGDAAHGQYLAEHVAMCVECHSARDASGVILDTQRYMGAPLPITSSHGDDWAMRAPRNRGLPGYDDTQALRLLMDGAIARDGRQLRPPMPRFRMTRQDAADVIAFLRSLQ
jgi:mono/diheme cytochrome c family protein